MLPLKLTKGPEGTLTRKDLFFIALGQVVGSGIVTVVGVGMNQTGPSAWLAYFVALLIGAILVFPYFMLGSTIRLGGGVYSAVTALMDEKWAGIYGVSKLPGIVALASFPITIAFYIASVFTGVNQTVVALVALAFFFIVQILGINVFAKIQKYMGYVLLVSMFSFVLFGLPHIKWAYVSPAQENFFTHGASGFWMAVFLMVSSTKGYYNSVNFGKNAVNAKKDVPVSMVFSFLTITVLYLGVAFVDIGVLPLEQVAGQPLTLVAKEILPTVFFYVFIFGGVLMALTTSLNSSFAVLIREVETAVEDGWLPTGFAKKNRFGTSTYVVIAVFIIALLPILTNFSVSKILSAMLLFTSTVNIVVYVAIFRLPKLYPDEWERKTVKMTKPVFYALMAVSMAMLVATLVFSCRSVGLLTAVISLASMGVAAVYAYFRAKSGNYKIRLSVWND